MPTLTGTTVSNMIRNGIKNLLPSGITEEEIINTALNVTMNFPTQTLAQVIAGGASALHVAPNTFFVARCSDVEAFLSVASDGETLVEISGSSGGSTPQFVYTFPYQNLSPVQTSGVDTLVSAASLPANTEVLVNLLFTVDSSGNTYAVSIPIENTLAQLQMDIRQLLSSEPVTGSGDVALSAWIDGTTGTYWFSLDVDGGGKTLNSVSVVTKTLTSS